MLASAEKMSIYSRVDLFFLPGRRSTSGGDHPIRHGVGLMRVSRTSI
jgi:hypothetical protein